MKKFYSIDELQEIIEDEQYVQIFGCPYYLEIDSALTKLINEVFVWDSPKNILVFSNSIEFTSMLMGKVQLSLKEMSVPYTYDKSNYTIKDTNSELRIKLINKKNNFEVVSKFYDIVLIHFCEDKTENIFEKICAIGKKIVFFTLDDEKSIFYSLNDEDNFYRLYSDHSNEKINEFLNSEVIDEKARQVVEGKFENNGSEFSGD